jgi:hypothetical protein
LIKRSVAAFTAQSLPVYGPRLDQQVTGERRAPLREISAAAV